MSQSRTTSAPSGPGGMLPPTVLYSTRLPGGRGQMLPPCPAEFQRLRGGRLCYRGVGNSKATQTRGSGTLLSGKNSRPGVLRCPRQCLAVCAWTRKGERVLEAHRACQRPWNWITEQSDLGS